MDPALPSNSSYIRIFHLRNYHHEDHDHTSPNNTPITNSLTTFQLPKPPLPSAHLATTKMTIPPTSLTTFQLPKPPPPLAPAPPTINTTSNKYIIPPHPRPHATYILLASSHPSSPSTLAIPKYTSRITTSPFTTFYESHLREKVNGVIAGHGVKRWYVQICRSGEYSEGVNPVVLRVICDNRSLESDGVRAGKIVSGILGVFEKGGWSGETVQVDVCKSLEVCVAPFPKQKRRECIGGVRLLDEGEKMGGWVGD